MNFHYPLFAIFPSHSILILFPLEFETHHSLLTPLRSNGQFTYRISSMNSICYSQSLIYLSPNFLHLTFNTQYILGSVIPKWLLLLFCLLMIFLFPNLKHWVFYLHFLAVYWSTVPKQIYVCQTFLLNWETVPYENVINISKLTYTKLSSWYLPPNPSPASVIFILVNSIFSPQNSLNEKNLEPFLILFFFFTPNVLY